MVVCPDLRGYGESPKSGSDFSKRAMAADVLALMHQLGYERFAVAGHDRGALVGQRLALEHPEAVSHLAVLDNVPVLDMWESIGADAAVGAYHLFFLAQPSDLPEHLLAGSPEAFVDSFLDGWTTVGGAISDEARAAYHRAFSCPEDIRAVCEDYRAGATVDLEHDRADREAGRRLAAPLLVLWQEPGGAAPPFDPLAIWRGWRTTSRGAGSTAGTSCPRNGPTRWRPRCASCSPDQPQTPEAQTPANPARSRQVSSGASSGAKWPAPGTIPCSTWATPAARKPAT